MYRLLDNVLIFTMPKCASQSLYRASEPASPQHGALTFIRDPIERLVSYFNHQWRYPDGHNRFLIWESFVDFTLGNSNIHWQPQAELMRDGFTKKAILFEKLSEFSIPHLNQSAWPARTSDYRAVDLKNHYAEDFELRDDLSL